MIGAFKALKNINTVTVSTYIGTPPTGHGSPVMKECLCLSICHVGIIRLGYLRHSGFITLLFSFNFGETYFIKHSVMYVTYISNSQVHPATAIRTVWSTTYYQSGQLRNITTRNLVIAGSECGCIKVELEKYLYCSGFVLFITTIFCYIAITVLL